MRWHKTTDRVPDDERDVLARNRGGDAAVAWYDADRWYIGAWQVTAPDAWTDIPGKAKEDA